MQKTAKSNDQKAHSNSPSDASLRHSATTGAPDSEQPGTKHQERRTSEAAAEVLVDGRAELGEAAAEVLVDGRAELGEAAAEVLVDSRAGRGEPPPTSKPCRTCGEELPVTAFYQHRGCRDAHRPDCKHCTGLRCSETRAARRR